MKRGEFPERAPCAAVLLPFCVSFGNGAKKKRKQLTARPFTFYRIANYSARPRVSLPALCRITNIFRRDAGTRSGSRRRGRCDCWKKIGRLSVAVPGRDRAQRSCGTSRNYAVIATMRPKIWIWNLSSLRRERRWKQSPPTRHARRDCSFRGNSSCLGSVRPNENAQLPSRDKRAAATESASGSEV